MNAAHAGEGIEQGAPAWMAAGVCHEILLRTLPSLRHDMAGQLSVARMDLALLKRWLAKGTLSADDGAAAERVQRIDQQFVALLQALQALQAWGQEEPVDTPAVSEWLDACLGWVRPVLMLAKVTVERGADPALPFAPVSQSAFKYLCLGAVWGMVDQHGPSLAQVMVTLEAPGTLCIAATRHPVDAPAGVDRAPQPTWARLDESALRAVARQAGWQLTVQPSCWRLSWA